MRRCDFCGQAFNTNELHYFESDPVDVYLQGVLIMRSDKNWFACDECAVAIRANDADTLLMRTLETYSKLMRIPYEMAYVAQQLQKYFLATVQIPSRN